MRCQELPENPAEIRKFLRSDDGAVWAYAKFLESGRRYEPVAALCFVHYNTIKKAVRRGEELAGRAA